MNNTNVEYYIAGFDADGKRVGSSICEFDPKKSKNVNKLDELKKKRKICLPMRLLSRLSQPRILTSIYPVLTSVVQWESS